MINKLNSGHYGVYTKRTKYNYLLEIEWARGILNVKPLRAMKSCIFFYHTSVAMQKYSPYKALIDYNVKRFSNNFIEFLSLRLIKLIICFLQVH